MSPPGIHVVRPQSSTPVPTGIQPKIIVRPGPRPGGVVAVWLVNGREAEIGAPDVVSSEFVAAPRRFEVSLTTDRVVARFPVDDVTLSIRDAAGVVHAIRIARRTHGLAWSVDDRQLPAAAPGPGDPKPGFPPEFFGEFCGLSATGLFVAVNLQLIIEF